MTIGEVSEETEEFEYDRGELDKLVQILDADLFFEHNDKSICFEYWCELIDYDLDLIESACESECEWRSLMADEQLQLEVERIQATMDDQVKQVTFGPFKAELSAGSTEFADSIRAAADERLRFIRANRERLMEAWIAETGLRPSESELVEQHHADGTLTVHVRRLEANHAD